MDQERWLQGTAAECPGLECLQAGHFTVHVGDLLEPWKSYISHFFESFLLHDALSSCAAHFRSLLVRSGAAQVLDRRRRDDRLSTVPVCRLIPCYRHLPRLMHLPNRCQTRPLHPAWGILVMAATTDRRGKTLIVRRAVTKYDVLF